MKTEYRQAARAKQQFRAHAFETSTEPNLPAFDVCDDRDSQNAAQSNQIREPSRDQVVAESYGYVTHRG